jgi:hypothetical protein
MNPRSVWRRVRPRIVDLADRIGVARRGGREPDLHWLRRCVQLSLLERLAPDPLGSQSGMATDIDVVIPVGPRDIDVLPLTLEGVQRNLAGPIGQIWCVAPGAMSEELRRSHPDVTVIDERDVVGGGLATELNRFGARAGWMMQQLITLSTPEISSADAALVIDADTVLVRPRRFRVGDKTLLLTAREFNVGYYETLARLWGEPIVLPPFSCIAHHMCFLRDDVLAMRRAIEARRGTSWPEALLDACPPGKAALSEYELYGQWRLTTARDKTYVRPMRNVGRPRSPAGTVDALAKQAPERAYSVSHHWYL